MIGLNAYIVAVRTSIYWQCRCTSRSTKQHNLSNMRVLTSCDMQIHLAKSDDEARVLRQSSTGQC